MKINPYIFRNYDIRGIVGEDLDEQKVEALGKAYGTLLKRRKIKQAVVGHDCRLSGPSLQKAFINGLTSTGVNVIDLGHIMTQMMYFAQYYYQTCGGAILTASHNPAKYNGFKLAVGFSKTTEQEEVQELRRYVENDAFEIAETPGVVEKRTLKKPTLLIFLKGLIFGRNLRLYLIPEMVLQVFLYQNY